MKIASNMCICHAVVLLFCITAVLLSAPAAAQDGAGAKRLDRGPIRLYLYLRPEEMTVGMTTYLVVEVQNDAEEQISRMLVKPAVGTCPPAVMKGKVGWELRVWGLPERDCGFNAPTVPYEKPTEIDVPAGAYALVRVTVHGAELPIWGPYTFSAGLYHDGRRIALSEPARVMCGPMPTTAPSTSGVKEPSAVDPTERQHTPRKGERP